MTSDNIYIAEYNQTKYLVVSSLFFIIQSIYAFLYNLYFYSIFILTTTLISVNYWRKATYSYRRDIDLVFAKISFITLLCNGIIYIRTPFYIITSCTGFGLLTYFYYLSGKLLNKKKNDWFKYHFLFHLVVTYELIIILHSIILHCSDNDINLI